MEAYSQWSYNGFPTPFHQWLLKDNTGAEEDDDDGTFSGLRKSSSKKKRKKKRRGK